jgi:hypothetical protein
LEDQLRALQYLKPEEMGDASKYMIGGTIGLVLGVLVFQLANKK